MSSKNNMIDRNGNPTYSTIDAMMHTYPYWTVEGYRCEQYSEALELAKQMKHRLNRPITIMEKLDPMTAFYSVGTV